MQSLSADVQFAVLERCGQERDMGVVQVALSQELNIMPRNFFYILKV